MERYVTVSWDYVDRLCRRIAFQIIEDGFKPDKIVALAKGGWFVARVVRDYLGVGKLVSLDLGEEETIKCEKALIVDDLINTGKTIRAALKAVEAEEVKTATLLMLQNSDFIPDYLGEYLWDYSWVIFPWNFVEDLSELILKVLKEKGEVSQWALKGLLFSEFGLDPLNLDISHPGRFEEVLTVLEARGLIERKDMDGRTYWRLKE